MRIFTVFLFSLLVAWSSAAAFADEGPSFLERLSTETVRLAEKGRAAVVTVGVPGREAPGVLVGTPPRIVVERIVVTDAKEITFRLANGTEGKATRLADDEELGLAVYALPPEVEAKEKGLTPAATWDVAPGTLAVLCGERPTLVLLPGSAGRRTRLEVRAGTAGHLLLSVRGELLGYRAHPLVVNVSPGMPVVVARSLDVLRGRYDAAQAARVRALDALRRVNGATVPTPPSPPSSPAVSLVPGPLIARVLKDVEAHGRIRQAYVGVVPGEVQGGRGARLVGVVPGSPAAVAGLQEGQVIVRIDAQTVPGPAEFTRAVLLRTPGERIAVRLAARSEPVTMVLADRSTAMRGILAPRGIGLVGMDLTPELAKYLELDEETRGVVVRKAPPPGSWAAKAGLKRGDVIVEGDGEPVRDIGELLAALNGAGDAIDLTVLREGKRLQIRMALPQANPKTPR